MALVTGKDRYDGRPITGDVEEMTGTALYVADTPASGGGGIGGWDPNGVNGTPHALDAEFNNDTTSAWPGGWTAWAAGDLENQVMPNVEPGQLSTVHSSGAAWKGRYATIPVGDFNLGMRGGSYGSQSSFGIVGVGVADNAGTNLSNAYSIYYGTHSALGAHGVLTDSANAAQTTWLRYYPGQELTIWIRRVGSVLTCGWSPDGRRGVETTTVTPGWTPSHIWVRAFGNTATVVQTIKWVRVRTASGAIQTWGAWV